MPEVTPFTFDEEDDDKPSAGETKLLREHVADRCNKVGFKIEDVEGFGPEDNFVRIEMPCGKEKRWVLIVDHSQFQRLLNIPFEEYTFLTGLDAICHYSSGTIEAVVRTLSSPTNSRLAYARLFGVPLVELENRWSSLEVKMESGSMPTKVTASISPASVECQALTGSRPTHLSLKIQRDGLIQHDQSMQLLRKVADALFFQIDLLTDLPLSLARDRKSLMRRRTRIRGSLAEKPPEFPRVEYDSAPMSLYWYARSATGLPLLQFLAFYQVIEFYYPTYSQAEARRKLRALLKDPTFRGDRDADLGKVLAAIQVSRSGGFGDERSQLKATILECVDLDDLRQFVTSDSERSAFLSSKSKGLTDLKLTVANENMDLRAEAAERLYDIRCRIVHTKTDARTGQLDLLLPFSKEAEQLHHDIELAQYLAQRVLFAASIPFQG